MSQDRLPPPLKPADGEREAAVRAALIEHDSARAMDLMRGYAFTEEFRNDILGGAMHLGDDLPFVRFVIEEMDTDISPTRCISLLNAACQNKLADTTVYLVERALAENISREDCYSRIFTNFPPEDAAAVVQKLAEKAEDRDAALSDALYQAAIAKTFPVMGPLVEAGAAGGKHMALVLLSYLMCQDQAFYNDKDAYLGTFRKIVGTATPQHMTALDLTLPMVAYKIPGGDMYPEIMDILVQAGADPFAVRGEASRALTAAYNERGDFEEEARWRQYFDQAREAYTGRCHAAFQEKFGNGFSVSDLLQTVNAAGDTGLTLAARARRADAVLDAAAKDGSLTLAQMFNETAGKPSVISLAIDRGDLAQWLRPAYWLKQDPQILQKVEEKLTDEQKKHADLDMIAARINQHRLKQNAGRFKLGPRNG